ncbi:MAG TPA: hypothetical protein VGD76_00045 [Ramlibacter sp.]
MNVSILRSTFAACLIGVASAAQAAFMSVVPDAFGNFTVTDTTHPNAGDYQFNIQPTTNPNPVIYYDQNPPTNQSPSAIQTLIASHYSVDPASLALAGSCDDVEAGCSGLTSNSTTFALSGVPQFEYLAIHLGGGELFFHWSQPITSMLLTALDGFPSGRSNYRSYSAVPLPGALALFLGALGFFGVRQKLAGRVRGKDLAAG